MEKIINYYGGGNTARGFVPLYNSILQGLDVIYSLNGGSNIYKTYLLKELTNKYDNVEIINSALDNDEIEGVILRDLGIAVVNGTPIHESEINNKEVKTINIDLNKALDKVKISVDAKEVLNLKEEYSKCLKNSYEKFLCALQIHDEWEKFYISNMSIEKADQLTMDIIEKLISKSDSKDKNGRIYNRYLGAATPVGSKDFVPNITEGVRRYFIKGRPGTGKSTLLKKLAKATADKGYDVEVYHCGFDPNSIDMVISRELNFAIFDSTAPHEYFPDKEDDEVIDTYKELITSEVDVKYRKEISDLTEEYKNKVKEGVSFLAKGKEIKDKIDKIYDNSFNYSKGDVLVRASLNF